MAVEYAHTNIVAEDWEMVIRFDQNVFGCIPVPPRLPNAGAPHLRLHDRSRGRHPRDPELDMTTPCPSTRFDPSTRFEESCGSVRDRTRTVS